MTNRQWLLNQMQNMSNEELANAINCSLNVCHEELRGKCLASQCVKCYELWLKAEHIEKTKLSDVERVLLESIDEECKYIARDRSGMLYIYSEKPYKSDCDCWIVKAEAEGKCLGAFNHLFQFVKWEDAEPYNIEELLKNEDRN